MGNRNPPVNKIIFTEEQLAFMREHFNKMTNRQLADALGMRPTIVRTRCYEMGLKRMEMEYWTEEQIKYLKENYKKIGDLELAEMFAAKWHKEKGWNKKHIEKKRRYLNLKRTTEEKKAISKRNTEAGRFAMCAVKRWDKIGRTPVGTIKMTRTTGGRSIKVIKLKDGFVHYARWLWEQVYGGVPDGMIVRLKDGDPNNVSLANMELVSRAEHGQKNISKAREELTDSYIIGMLAWGDKELRPLIAANPELIELKRLQIQLKRTINDRHRENAATKPE